MASSKTSWPCSPDRNFETKQYEEAIAEEAFSRLKTGILNFMSKTHYDRLVMTLRSAGFVNSSLIGGQNDVNFAYIVYLRGRSGKHEPAADLERLVRRWYTMSVLTGRYAANPGNFLRPGHPPDRCPRIGPSTPTP